MAGAAMTGVAGHRVWAQAGFACPQRGGGPRGARPHGAKESPPKPLQPPMLDFEAFPLWGQLALTGVVMHGVAAAACVASLPPRALPAQSPGQPRSWPLQLAPPHPLAEAAAFVRGVVG